MDKGSQHIEGACTGISVGCGARTLGYSLDRIAFVSYSLKGQRIQSLHLQRFFDILKSGEISLFCSVRILFILEGNGNLFNLKLGYYRKGITIPVILVFIEEIIIQFYPFGDKTGGCALYAFGVLKTEALIYHGLISRHNALTVFLTAEYVSGIDSGPPVFYSGRHRHLSQLDTLILFAV